MIWNRTLEHKPRRHLGVRTLCVRQCKKVL